MKKVIRHLSEDKSTVQITICDERWYLKHEMDSEGKITGTKEYPSVTWICGQYPKGVGFYRWLADKGWDEAEAEKEAAGDRGRKVHHLVSSLLLGNEIKMDDTVLNSETGEQEPITLEEYEASMSFVEWHKEAKPKTLANEITIWNDKDNYAGTLDYICEIDGEIWLIDFKTSKEVYASHEIQLSAYKNSCTEFPIKKMAILQLGYKKNKYKKWKLTEIEDQYDLFQAAHRIWKKECGGMELKKKDYPTSISLS